MGYGSFCATLLMVMLASQPPVGDAITFPDIHTPTPAPAPNAVVVLPADRLYVVTSDVDLLAWSFPEGLIKITKESGPLKIRARFAGVSGNGLETREYKAKHVLIIEATGTGRVSLLVLPAGATSKSAGVVKVLDVSMAPRPPPGPEPEPKPDPKPEPKPEPKPVNEGPRFVVIIEETADGVAGRAKLFTDPVISARMKEKGHKFRIADKDVIGSDGKPPADIARFIEEVKGKTLPVVFFVDQRGATVQSGALPATPGAFLEALKKAGG